MILVGGLVGALAAHALSANPILQVGLIAFGGESQTQSMPVRVNHRLTWFVILTMYMLYIQHSGCTPLSPH